MFKNYYSRLRRQLPLIILTSLFTLCFAAEKAGFYHWAFVDRAENLLYDLRIVTTMPNEKDSRIVIVDIDERSLREIGRWPWSRNQVARMVNELFGYYEISILGFDVVFPEPDYSSGLNVLKAMGRNWLAGSGR